MPNTKFKFTKDDAYAMIIQALQQQPGTPSSGNTGNAPKPNLLQGLLAKSKIKANQ